MENPTNSEQKIFFSYSRVDGEQYALKLANDLRAAGANVWIDQLDIELGKLWDLEVEKALNAANCILFIATEKSTTSNNVLNEVYYALDENKKVIPVVFHNCRIPFGLKRLQRIDFTTNYDTAFHRLKKALGLKDAETRALQPDEEEMLNKEPEEKAAEENEEIEKEELFWKDALRENTAAFFAEYLRLYPEGQHKVEAQRRMEALRANELPVVETEKKQVKPSPQERIPVVAEAVVTSAIPSQEKSGRSKKGWLWGISAGVAALLIFFVIRNFTTTNNDENSIGQENLTDSSTDNTLGKDNPGDQPTLYIISPADSATIDYPRTTKVVWNEVPGATSYLLVVEIGEAQSFDVETTYSSSASYTTTQTTYTFEGTAYQVHRYKVIAKEGETTLTETPWRYVAYSG